MSLDDTMYKQPLGITPKGVIFDLDDTLYPEQSYVLSGFNAVAQYVDRIYGIKMYDDLIQCYVSGERTNVFGETLSKHFKVVEDLLLQKVVHIYWSHTPRISLYDDARICMALLFSRAIKVGVITTGPSSIQRNKIHALELEQLLDGIIYTDELLGINEPGQPCEDAFHILALQLNLELNEICYIGDNPLTDFATPRRIGVKTIRICRNDSQHANAKPPSIGYQADRVIHSLADLPALFKRYTTS